MRRSRCRRDFSARIARNTQIYLQEETGITKVVDPWAGSYYVETLTHELMRRAWQHIQEIEALGGMTKAIETGLPKMRIEEAAARRQARIDSGREVIVGVNKYRLPHARNRSTCRRWTTAPCARARCAASPRVRGTRDAAAVQAALASLTRAADTGRATCWRWPSTRRGRAPRSARFPSALEAVFGRYQAVSRTISGVYSSESQRDPEFLKARQMAESVRRGRRPASAPARGEDGAGRARSRGEGHRHRICRLGFDVDVGPLFQTPREAARMAAENDVHVLGVSSLAGGHKTLVPEVIAELKRLGRDGHPRRRRRRRSAAGPRVPAARRAWRRCSVPAASSRSAPSRFSKRSVARPRAA